jgi:hypothetical protein
MKQTSLKSIQRHTAAVNAGTVDKTNVIGIRKAINAMESGNWPAAMIDAQFELERAIAERQPTVTGTLHETGLKVLRNRRYAARWNELQAEIIANADHFELIRFDRVGHRYSVPVYRVVSSDGRGFAFRNVPWQTARYEGLDDGPRVVPEREG